MYYAMFHPYGITTTSGNDSLVKFESRKARDLWVTSEVFDGSNYHHSAVTRDRAREIFPDAFNSEKIERAKHDQDFSCIWVKDDVLELWAWTGRANYGY